VEYVSLGLNNQTKYYPLEEVLIKFEDNGSYTIETQLLFDPPQFDKKTLHHFYNANNALLEKLKKEIPLTKMEIQDIQNLPNTYLICYLNDFPDAKDKLVEAKPFLKAYSKRVYDSYRECVRILRKLKYN
jgi:hypothetical protein